jgi:tetratricopeptide (TPR) repeat protein
MIEALLFGQRAIEPLLAAQEKLAKSMNAQKRGFEKVPLAEGAVARVREVAYEKVRAAYELHEKHERYGQLSQIKKEVVAQLCAEGQPFFGKEKDVNLIAQLQKEGQASFSSAEENIKKRIEELTERKEDPAVEGTYISARFNLPKTYYLHSLLYPAGDFAKKKLLEDAITAFQEFGLDYSDRLLNYEACIFAGLCYKELASKEDAIQSFNEAIALREQYEKDAKGVWLVEPASADVVSKAVLQKINMLVDQNDSRGAVDVAKDYFATVMDPYEALNGLAILAAMVREVRLHPITPAERMAPRDSLVRRFLRRESAG